MISSDLEGADLESRVASWAASATSGDAAAVRAVIEAYGDRLAAADVAGVLSQYTGNAAVMQPELETVVGSQQLTATYDAAFENMRLDFTFRFDDITVKGDLAAVRATSQGTITIRATGETQPRVSGSCSFWNARGPLEDHAVHDSLDVGAVRRGLLRHLASPPPGFGHVPHPLAVAEHDAAPTSTCPYRGRAGGRRRSGAVRVPALGAVGAAGGHASRPPMHWGQREAGPAV
jgi:ketosteroid isomerase-like protein